MTHNCVGGISIAGTVYALLTVYVKIQDSQMSRYKIDFFVHQVDKDMRFAAATHFHVLYQGESKRTKIYACKLVVQEKRDSFAITSLATLVHVDNVLMDYR